jgi:hypothetical protein
MTRSAPARMLGVLPRAEDATTYTEVTHTAEKPALNK